MCLILIKFGLVRGFELEKIIVHVGEL